VRIGVVVGKVSLQRVHPSMVGKRYVLVQPQGLKALTGGEQSASEELVAVDELGTIPETRVGFSEGAEAAAPFQPEKKPVDAYVGCIIDDLDIDQAIASKLMEGK
jgi:ethanolamine utilization protein EutN